MDTVPCTSIPRLRRPKGLAPRRSISVAGVRPMESLAGAGIGASHVPPCTSIPRLCRSISVAGVRPMESLVGAWLSEQAP